MSDVVKNKTRLDFRITVEKKKVIEQAAGLSGQTVSDFAVSILVKKADEIIKNHQQTELSNRDRDLFLSLLESEIMPEKSLKNAVKNYKENVKANR